MKLKLVALLKVYNIYFPYFRVLFPSIRYRETKFILILQVTWSSQEQTSQKWKIERGSETSKKKFKLKGGAKLKEKVMEKVTKLTSYLFMNWLLALQPTW